MRTAAQRVTTRGTALFSWPREEELIALGSQGLLSWHCLHHPVKINRAPWKAYSDSTGGAWSNESNTKKSHYYCHFCLARRLQTVSSS